MLLDYFANSKQTSDTVLDASFSGFLQNAVNAMSHLRQEEGFPLMPLHTRQLLELLQVFWKLLQLSNMLPEFGSCGVYFRSVRALVLKHVTILRPQSDSLNQKHLSNS
jgi:hypothetical protein